MRRRLLRWSGLAVWVVWNTAALLAISFGGAWILVSAFSKSGPVWVASDVRLLTPTVPVRGALEWIVSVDAQESCPGMIVTKMTSITNHGPPATVQFASPITRPGRDAIGAKVSLDLPDSVFPGRWNVVRTVDSQCPKRVQTDKLSDFTIEVVP